MFNRYYDKQALESSFGGFQGSTPFMFDGSIPGQAGRVMPVRHGTVETVRNIFNSSPDKVKSILKRYPVVSGALGIASFAGLGYGAAALADRYNRDRTAGYIAYNRYLDKIAEDSFIGRNPGTAGALIGGTVAGGMAIPRAVRAVSKIKKDPALLLQYKTKYPMGRLGLAAGIAAGIIGLGGAGIGAVGGKLMGRPEKKPRWYDRFAGYNQGNPYLDKTAVSQALYNSAVKKRLMNQIMGYGTNPSRTVNLPVIQNNMKNTILKNRDMSALRAITSGPVSGQDGYSGLFRNINIRNNAARNTGNLTAEALREMPWYMRPLTMVS